ncbi:hypothetical protein BK010_05615 [Tenericutes bacterium MO-XQ]|nr:hypothetical protein BK010_05615 [Tenericutes bacterium MO-XQ]
MIKKQFKNYENYGYYFPLFNLKGFRSAITPFFAGDVKTDLHHYAIEPASELELYEHTQSRNVLFIVDGNTYFLNGQTHLQQDDDIVYETDMLYQKVIRINASHQIETISFVPLDEMAELHQITYKNTTTKNQKLRILTATPIYGRSADNLRDHRHVTSLLNRIDVKQGAIVVNPTLSFDERGHQDNDTIYTFIADSNDLNIDGYIPTVDEYLNGGSFHFPKGLDRLVLENTHIDGYEAMGSVSFEEVEIKPNQSITIYMAIAITNKELDLNTFKKTYLNESSFKDALNKTNAFFAKYVEELSFDIDSKETSNQLRWVALQPLLRRYYGNSFLPLHDYGKGGRGWRDLWQDLLALIMTNDDSVFELLYSNFAGIRIDGSNATIIGDQPGEFKADRNSITRVWSDHGVWPLITTKLYIDESGDIDFLLRKQTYFQDKFTHYTKQTTTPHQKNLLRSKDNQVYEGTILEHLLVENLVGYHNVGKHGFTKLEDADWNDGLDMATKLGETIAFTHMYAENLSILAHLIKNLKTKDIELFEGFELLLDTNANLSLYFEKAEAFSGIKITKNRDELANILNKLSEDKKAFLNEKAFENDTYQSYYNNDGELLDNEETLSLTGQAMALLAHTPSQEQALKIAQKTKEKLFNPSIGGYHLNSDHHKVLHNMGRAFGFAYNHKENGAIFSHMVMMYAYGLYVYNLSKEGREAAFSMLYQSQKTESHVWAGIPEYFTEKGVGKYTYLTGSASWLLLLIRNQTFGIRFDLGKLTLQPKLTKADFIDGKASITTYLFNQKRKVTYHNHKHLEYGSYQISKILSNGKLIKQPINQLENNIEVYLDEII